MANVQLDDLNEVVVEDLSVLLEYFSIDYVTYQDRVSFTCPIHDSDNEESLSIFTDGHTSKGNWRCWTNACEQEILSDGRPLTCSIFGLTRGLIGIEEQREISYGEAIKFLMGLYGYENAELEAKYSDAEYGSKKKFIKIFNILNRSFTKIVGTKTREEVRRGLKIPSQYFIGRGFPAELLDKYDVGFCETINTEMADRVVVPVYDNDHKLMVGCIGRSSKPLCTECNGFHDLYQDCPSNKVEKRRACKWLNSKGFRADSILYNFWFAKEHILKSGWAILVEGQGDVWKLEMALYKIGLGIFGDSLGDQQRMVLDTSGALNLLILTDGDEAGLKAREKIRVKCKRSYNCVFMDLPKKDLGEMRPAEIRNFLEPVLGGVL